MDIKEQMAQIAAAAKKTSGVVARLGSSPKNAVLRKIADALEANTVLLISENNRDLQHSRATGIAGAMLERLTMTKASIHTMAAGVREVANLPDPVGEVGRMWRRPNGLLVGKMRIPLGVIAIIYEARPNVTVDAAALCFKAGNAVILRGGSEAINSNMAMGKIIGSVLEEEGIPADSIQVITTTDRQAIYELLQLEEYIDLVIPRGGEALIRAVVAQSKIPVIKHYKGVCHIYVDEDCDLSMALSIVMNAKTQRVGVCNALETLLVHRNIAAEFFALLAPPMRDAGVVIRGCSKTSEFIADAQMATEADWYEEYLALILAVRVVESIDEAIAHIEKYGSLHTEAIITNSYQQAQKFLHEVNSSTVVVNASTRFSDGFELGLGAEIGISTSKLHAFGPMGLEELTTSKFIIYGNGQVRK
ncbi:MAG: glutamate-5-semialdehyde dehydrogenase [Deltaproteobacteria bacterium]|nr:glutamate-5-semialdehyde dehydrogenase [Deltaproteobacteria bacterium]